MQKLSGVIHIDDGYMGGKLGRGSENKTPCIAAVSVNEDSHPINMNVAREHTSL